jgi:pimeloyl-ACP methyl ester carboxylesterase
MSGHHTVLHFNLQAREWATTERALGDADVYGLRAMLSAMTDHEADAKASIRAAVSLEPNHVMAHLVGAIYYKDKLSPAVGRAAAAAHPDDWRAWVLAVLALFRAEGESPEERAAEARVCELIAKNPAVVSPVSMCEAEQRSAPQ